MQPSCEFEEIVGHERIKKVFRLVIASPKPVHVLLYGPPGNAKSAFLLCLERRFPESSVYLLGSRLSAAGAWDELIQRGPGTRFLLVDELDKLKRDQYGAFLSLCWHGRLRLRLKHRSVDMLFPELRMISTANSLRRIPPELLSRLLKIFVPPYTREEFVEVSTRVLVQLEGVDEGMAEFISVSAADLGITDVRECVKVARLARERETALEILRMIKDGYRGVRSGEL